MTLSKISDAGRKQLGKAGLIRVDQSSVSCFSVVKHAQLLDVLDYYSNSPTYYVVLHSTQHTPVKATVLVV